MTARRKELLAIFVVMLVLVFVGGTYWQSIQLKQLKKNNETKSNLTNLDNTEKEIAGLNKELGRMIAEADLIIKSLQPSPLPAKRIKKSYHDGGYEDAWIQDIDQKKGIVLVETIKSKMSIVFKPATDDLQKFNVGWLAPVTFQCTKLKKGKCDFKSPYKLFVSNGLVEVKQLKFQKK